MSLTEERLDRAASEKECRDSVSPPRPFRRGDLVAVRTWPEILGTLDGDGKCDGMPFMPEMVRYCGGTARVFARIERSCVEGAGIRGVKNCVLLEGLRCDGSAHDGCQRRCLFFWNDAWLTPPSREQVAADAADAAAIGGRSPGREVGAGAEDAVAEDARHRAVSHLVAKQGDRYYCQSTELAAATYQLPPGRLRHYLHDLRVGQLRLGRFFYLLWRIVTNRAGRLLRGASFYELRGKGKKTVSEELDLQPGEWVEIKSAEEIKATLDDRGRNRGMNFEPEMALHCGRRYRVAARLTSIIAEDTGKMLQLKNTVILDGMLCEGICAINCPRANYFYWREAWLKRVAS